MQFIHEATRLGCDANRAFRFFTRPEMFIKWADATLEIDLKKGGSYYLADLKTEAHQQVNSQGSTISHFEREKELRVLWRDSVFAEGGYELHIRFMPCRSDTEFCTELHLVFKHLEHELSDVEYAFYGSLFKELFVKLRQYVNKDWIIQDSDLSLSWLKGSSF